MPGGKRIRYILERRLGGLWSWSERYGEKVKHDAEI
jgi:hypothetical protein